MYVLYFNKLWYYFDEIYHVAVKLRGAKLAMSYPNLLSAHATGSARTTSIRPEEAQRLCSNHCTAVYVRIVG